MRPSSWNGVGAIANVPAALAVSLVMCASILFVIPERASWRGPGIHTHGALGLGPFARTNYQARLLLVCRECGKPQARCGYGFRARDLVAPRNDHYLNLRADFFISS